MKKIYFNSLYQAQALAFQKQHRVQFKKFNLGNTYINLLDQEYYMDLTCNLDPRIHSINAFFTFFLIHDHSIDNIRGTGYSDLLWSSIDARTLYAGSLTESKRSFCGVQSKEFYPLSEFITINDLWPDKTDIRIKDKKTLRSRLSKPFIILGRKVINKLTRGWLFATPYKEILSRRRRGYATLMDELVKQDRQDLIALCEKYSAKSIFPLILRSVADCDPHRLMNMSADESIRYAMQIFYKHKYRMNIFEKFKNVYIPRVYEFAVIMSALHAKKKS